jgi:hypothetical protein
MWIGTKGMGLYMIDNGRFYHFEKNENDNESLSSNDIYDIHALNVISQLTLIMSGDWYDVIHH